MLSALRKNSLSIVLSTAALSGYGGWLSLPESASIQTIYDRYIAREESRPRVFDEGITVRLNREAPPVAALEEALRDEPWAAIERPPGFNVRAIELRAEPNASERLAMRILSENENFARQVAQASVIVPAAAPASAPVQQIAPPIVLPQHRNLVPATRGGASYVASGSDPVMGPTGRPLEKLAAPATQTTRVISLSKTGMTREQLLAALFGPMSRPVGVTGNGVTGGTSRGGSAFDAASSNRETLKTDVASRAMGMVAPAGRQIMIRGPIEFAEGLALTHAKDRIAVLRESRGQFIESGAVSIRDARYEIFVESLEGSLVAEVRSPQGEVVGRGHMELSSIAANDRKNLDGVALRVMPVTAGFSGRVQSAYTTGTSAASVSKGVQGARVEFLQTPTVVKSVSGGHFEESHFTEGSRVVASVEAKDHWPTLTTLVSGIESVVPVFSKKMMQAFVSLTAKDEAAADVRMKTEGVVWGRVTRAGQTVQGAQIEVITHAAGEPVYFNDLMLPDASMTATGSNGLFALPGAAVGTHALQVRLGKRLSDPVFLQADAASVSSVELDVLKASDLEARAFDAFRTDLPLRAEVKPMGHLKSRMMVVEGDGDSHLKLAHMGHPSILEIDGGSNYIPMRMTQNPEARNLYIPMVQRAWFDRVIGSMRYNLPAGAGSVLGFIQGSRFRISMDEKSLSAGARIVYFDSRGEITTQNYGEPGGGFILMGVANGLQTVLVEADGSDRVFAATVFVEDGHVAALSHWLR